MGLGAVATRSTQDGVGQGTGPRSSGLTPRGRAGPSPSSRLLLSDSEKPWKKLLTLISINIQLGQWDLLFLCSPGRRWGFISVSEVLWIWFGLCIFLGWKPRCRHRVLTRKVWCVLPALCRVKWARGYEACGTLPHPKDRVSKQASVRPKVEEADEKPLEVKKGESYLCFGSGIEGMYQPRKIWRAAKDKYWQPEKTQNSSFPDLVRAGVRGDGSHSEQTPQLYRYYSLTRNPPSFIPDYGSNICSLLKIKTGETHKVKSAASLLLPNPSSQNRIAVHCCLDI